MWAATYGGDPTDPAGPGPNRDAERALGGLSEAGFRTSGLIDAIGDPTHSATTAAGAGTAAVTLLLAERTETAGAHSGDGADLAGTAAPAEAGSLLFQSMADVSHGECAGVPAGPAGAIAPRKASSFPPPLKEIAIKADISERALLLCDAAEFKELLQDLNIPVRKRLHLMVLHEDLLIAADADTAMRDEMTSAGGSGWAAAGGSPVDSHAFALNREAAEQDLRDEEAGFRCPSAGQDLRDNTAKVRIPQSPTESATVTLTADVTNRESAGDDTGSAGTQGGGLGFINTASTREKT